MNIISVDINASSSVNIAPRYSSMPAYAFTVAKFVHVSLEINVVVRRGLYAGLLLYHFAVRL